MKLTAKEGQILRDVCCARIKVLHAGNSACEATPPVPQELTEQTARRALHPLDFFRSAAVGNVEAVKNQLHNQQDMEPKTGAYDFDGIISKYNAIITLQMRQGEYTKEDVLRLQSRIKGYVRTLKAGPARTLYISDCHFYHDRICREMDQRGFAGYEEMNAHMIQQWNKKVTSKDQVYILGDFSISKPDATEKVLTQLNGKLHLLIGNHDKYLEDRHYEWYSWFRSMERYQEISDNGRKVILSHYPVLC